MDFFNVNQISNHKPYPYFSSSATTGMHIKNNTRTAKTRFLRDDSARVPFVVIGIFLVILSTLVSLNLTRMDIKMAKTMSSNIEISAPDQALAYAKADLGTGPELCRHGSTQKTWRNTCYQP